MAQTDQPERTSAPQTPERIRDSHVIDLSAPHSGDAENAAGPAKGVCQDVTQENFASIVELSARVPVLIVLTSSRSSASTTVAEDLAQLAKASRGAFLLARVDADALPQVAQAFGAQAVPTVIALIKGQPIPLFQGTCSAEQMRQVVDEVLAVAAQNGMTERVPVEDEASEPEGPPPLPPLHQEAYDAIERGDLTAAEQAYGKAINDNPGDDDAKAGLANVHLMQRVAESSQPLEALILAADTAPDDAAAGLAAADAELSQGQPEQAFERLIELVRRLHGDDREPIRQRLVDYFAIIGVDDPVVIRARRALFSALY